MLLSIFLASIVGSVFALVGGLVLLWREETAKRWSLILVSFAAGSLLGVAFLDLVPEALEERPYDYVAPLIILGILAVFLFEKVLHWYHCHNQETCGYHSFTGAVLFGDAIHNFIDGITIALGFAAGPSVGVATTVAIFFHEVPQEIGDFGVLIHQGYSRSKVILWNVITALTTPLGAVLGYFLLPWISPFVGALLAFAAGTFIYISVSDLLPELRHHSRNRDWVHLLIIIAGVLSVGLIGAYLPE